MDSAPEREILFQKLRDLTLVIGKLANSLMVCDSFPSDDSFEMSSCEHQ